MDTSSSDSAMPAEQPSNSYIIGGVDIIFPYKAYPAQLSMMDKIIKSISKKQNCLLESPTGSGKSLALLCSALAWQRKKKIEVEEVLQTIENATTKTSVVNVPKTNEKNTILIDSPKAIPGMNVPKANEKKTILIDSPKAIPGMGNVKLEKFQQARFDRLEKKRCQPINYIDDDLDDFKPAKAYKTNDVSVASVACMSPINYKIVQEFPEQLSSAPCTPNSSSMQHQTPTVLPEKSSEAGTSEKCSEDCKATVEKTPMIYFGTRTHKQISQIIKELKKTPYKNTKMSILSSRNKTCIHPMVSKMENRNEACDELVRDKGGGCMYYRNYRKISHYNPHGLSEAWDIEDLIVKLKRMRACPYFSSRLLAGDSDIVFCPYNYLIDPLVRSALDISLKDSIVIMDEAHNLEDAARESTSFVLTQHQVEEAIADLFKIGQARGDKHPEFYKHLEQVLTELRKWLNDAASALTSHGAFEQPSKVYAGKEMVALLAMIGTGPDHFQHIKKMFTIIEKLESEIGLEGETEEFKLSGSTMFLLRGLLTILDYMYRDSMKHVDDYRCVVRKKKQFQTNALVPMNRNRYRAPEVTVELNFWCLNPAVAFSDIKGSVRCIIVTSGTLSPMSSFQSELGVPFDIMLETNHVISGSQVWVGTIGQGPSGLSLSATYANTETFSFQDEVGNLILAVCSIIPYGVLCFLPSYAMLDKLTTRWQTTQMWDRIMSKKVIVCEPRGQKFEAAMNEFYEIIKQSENGMYSEVTGALFLAVCRGKVSEGLDFTDNNARAVITIGIPFPSFKDSQVELKRKYNDSLSKTNGILSGSQWYEIQAFRALNQALGRCIRHRNDYGALIIVDERFQKQTRYINSLSKWIRKEVAHYQSFNDAMSSLLHFSEKSGLVNNQTDTLQECSE